MFFSGRFRGGKCVPHIKHVLSFMRACIKLFYIILDNFSLVRAPAKAYFSPFISFFYRSILLTSIFLSPFAKYGLFSQPLSLSSIFQFCQLSFAVITHSLFCLVFHRQSCPLSVFMYLYILHCRHEKVQVQHTILNQS